MIRITHPRLLVAVPLKTPHSITAPRLGTLLHTDVQPSQRGAARRSLRCYARNGEGEAAPQGDVKRKVYIVSPSGASICISKTPFVIGSGPTADLKIQGEEVLERHAEFQVGRGQVTIKALGGDPQDLMSETFTEMNEIPLRSQVSYLVCAGSKLRFGTSDALWPVEFEEQTDINPLNKVLIDNMVSTFSQEARNAFQDRSGL